MPTPPDADHRDPRRRAALRVAVAIGLSLATGILVVPAAVALSRSLPAGIVVAAVVGVLVGLCAWRTRSIVLDENACSPGLRIVSGITALVALVALARLAVFMVAPAASGYSLIPGSAWEVGHSCVTAYYVAGQALDTTPNPYADSLYTAPDDDPSGLRKARLLGPFMIDVYEYHRPSCC